MDNMQFRQDFPEFADTTKYPDAAVTLWMNAGIARMNQQRWQNAGFYDIGLELFTAHHLAIAAADQQAAAKGAAPGQATSVKASKSVGGVAVSIDTQISANAGAGFWNLTTYGTRFWELAQIVGVAGAQL